MDESKPNQSNMSNTKHPMARLMAAQMDIQAIVKDKVNPHFKKNYADINTMLAEVKPALHKHGLFVIQPIEDNQVITQIVDAETGNVLCESALTLSGQGNPQQRGSEITYYRRYTLQSLLSLEAEDDDANAASEPRTTVPPSPMDKPWLNKTDKAYLDACAWVKGKLEEGYNTAIARLEQTYKINNTMKTALLMIAKGGLDPKGGAE